ncbi:MAG: polynucleotide adenylyltransferase PcnB [Vicinamibacterales bacterium]
MGEPLVVPRDAHTLSRKLVDPDALKVLYRLHEHRHVAYLVGGSVRDLLLGRRPKDFDIGTSAHPYEVKKLFRNCWIIGRRFRLAHVRFGTKNIEVATFRRQVTAEELAAEPGPESRAGGMAEGQGADGAGERLVHRDNTFGTPEEDAFRRDFTINALFYDIGSFSIIDYAGGLEDLRAGLVRCIGDPNERFREDPVRMLRAIAMAARLDFTIDPPIDEAIAVHRDEIAKSAPARLIEEFYKLLRTGSAERAFRLMAERRLLESMSPDLQRGASDSLWQSLAALDSYRRRFDDAPATLSNAILLGSLLVPLNHPLRAPLPHGKVLDDPRKEPRISLGMLPLARRDVEHLRHILSLQKRLVDPGLSPRARQALIHRGAFPDALTWLEIHGESPEVVEHWRGFIEAAAAQTPPPEGEQPARRRRRRRRRPARPTPTQ